MSKYKNKTSTQTNMKDMEIKVEHDETICRNLDEEKMPLLQESMLPEIEKNLIQKAISQTFASTAHLANLLPTGSVLSFQLLAPIFTSQGHCDAAGTFLTSLLVSVVGFSCFILSFTDCYKDNNGNTCYGLATFNGLWIIDGSVTLPTQVASRYKIKFIDFMHAFMSVAVFAAVALLDENVVGCFYPSPSYQTQEILAALPVGLGVLCSILFVTFPTKRHGIGFPLTSAN